MTYPQVPEPMDSGTDHTNRSVTPTNDCPSGPKLPLQPPPYLCRLRSMRVTHSMIAVAATLAQEPDRRHWGYDLSRTAGVRSGVMYPILSRMLDEGWLEDGWEDPSHIAEKRPPRRY